LCACLVCHSWEGPRWPRGRPGRTCAYHSGKRICITNLGRTTYQFVRADHFIYGKCSVSGGGTGNRSLRALHRTIHRSAHTRYVFPTNHKQIGPTLSNFVFPKPLLFSSRHGRASLLLGHRRPCFPSRRQPGPTRRQLLPSCLSSSSSATRLLRICIRTSTGAPHHHAPPETEATATRNPSFHEGCYRAEREGRARGGRGFGFLGCGYGASSILVGDSGHARGRSVA
jgi:hypothetical protein